MRIAILSDIHGNDFAFSAVLADLTNKQIDQYICLGDVYAFGPQPLAALSRLQTLNCPVVDTTPTEHPSPLSTRV